MLSLKHVKTITYEKFGGGGANIVYYGRYKNRSIVPDCSRQVNQR